MLKKMLIAAAALGVSTTVLADPPHWAKAHGWRAKHHGHYGYRVQGHVPYYAPAPIVVVPAPRMVYAPPPPVVYYPAAPVYHSAPVYHPAPVYAPEPSLSIRLNFPL